MDGSIKRQKGGRLGGRGVTLHGERWMALKVPGKLRRIDTNEASAESQLSAEHTWTQGSAIQGYYQLQACLAAATLHFKQTRHWQLPTVMAKSAVDFHTFKQLFKA